MTQSGGLVRLLTSRSQRVSLLRLELSEVTKGTIVPFDTSDSVSFDTLSAAQEIKILLLIQTYLTVSEKYKPKTKEICMSFIFHMAPWGPMYQFVYRVIINRFSADDDRSKKQVSAPPPNGQTFNQKRRILST